MNPRTFLNAAVLILVGLLLGLFGGLSPPHSHLPQRPLKPRRQRIGHVQMAAINGGVIVNDTTTGTCWLHEVIAKKWTAIGSPTNIADQ